MKVFKRTINILLIINMSFFVFNMQIVNAKNNYSEASKEHSKVFMAGASTANITPPLGISTVGVGTATHIHDELQTRTLVLDDGTTKLAFIVVDLVGIPQGVTDEIKRIIEEEVGIPTSNVLISATHSHSTPRATNFGNKENPLYYGKPFNEYQAFIIRRSADAVRVAVNNLEPARIGWGVGSVPDQVFVRRWIMRKPVQNPFGGYDQVQMNPGYQNPNLLEPSAEPDPEVSFISIQSIDKKPIALLANYGLHYEGGVPRGQISADYYAFFADRIQELLNADRQNPTFVGIMSNGTSGDVNNRSYGEKREENAPYEKMRRVADDVAREIFRAHNKIDFHDWVPLSAVSENLTLAVRKPSKEMIERAKRVLNGPDKKVGPHNSEHFYNKRILEKVDWPDYLDVVIQSFRIGDLAVAAIPFEVFAETGLEIKDKSPFKRSLTISFANGAYGYLPTPKQHKLGGYETWMGINHVEENATTKIVATLLNQFENMK